MLQELVAIWHSVMVENIDFPFLSLFANTGLYVPLLALHNIIQVITIIIFEGIDLGHLIGGTT